MSKLQSVYFLITLYHWSNIKKVEKFHISLVLLSMPQMTQKTPHATSMQHEKNKKLMYNSSMTKFHLQRRGATSASNKKQTHMHSTNNIWRAEMQNAITTIL